MTSIASKLSQHVGEAFEKEGLSKDLGIVRISDRPDLAQFQCNGAMSAAKQAKKNPREVAQNIVNTLSTNDVFSNIEIAGPGFINLNVTDKFIEEHLQNLKNFGVSPTTEDKNIILDYGGPNIAKPMHVGHLRAAIIGDALRRIMSFVGYETLGDVHMGDWGTHMGMLIGDYLREGDQDIVLNTDLNDPQAVQRLMDDFAVRYPKASGEAKENPDLMREAQETTVKLQNKEEPYYGIWQKIRQISVEGMKTTYAKLGVHFDLWKGEADVHDYIAPMVEKMKDQGLAVEDDGALIVNVEEENDNKKIPPMILYKRDGAVMYGTTDCATIVEREKLYHPARMIYIVDQRQSLHFEQVFRAVRKAGIVNDSVELTHAGFGTMNGTDGKPFKTRAGGVMRLEDLIQMAVEKAQTRLSEARLAEDMEVSERDDVAHKVAIAAIKFADLQNQRQADYVFDLDRLTSFEGKTGPYLLYQVVRIKSLLRKAQEKGFKISKDGFQIYDEDRGLALLLCEFPDVLDLSIRSYAPHYLCEYIFKLAQAFSSFYGNCHILSEENEDLRGSRLLLCQKTAQQLEQILILLGINVPERM
ncbi:MAG: arginine--tRNA ligase [Alphaproteobacteria bacterium]|nr:arginine--tRNA ligase [Alphaproteobacteria bacterium]